MAETTHKNSRLINAVPFYYGWIILGAGTLATVMMGPSQTFTVGVFIDYLIRDLAISRSNISLVYGLATLAASLLLPLIGRQTDRRGSRLMALLAVIGLGLACVGMAGVWGIIPIFAAMLALRFFGFGSLQLVSNHVIAQWFVRRRGFVMGISGLSLPIGLMIFPWLAQFLIDSLTWRGAWVALGGLVWLVMLPVIWFFFKDTPEQYGLQPDGEVSAKTAAARLASETHWTLAEARRTGLFWIFAAALSTLTMMMAGMVFHQISLFESQGLSRDTAITAFNVIAVAAVVGNLGLGRLLDKYPPRLLLSLTMLLLAGTLIMLQVMHTPQQAYIYAAMQGLIGGCFRVMDSTVWAKYFGRRYLGSIKGFTMIGVIGGTAFGPYLLGFSLDYFGSYQPVLLAMLLPPLALALLAPIIKKPTKRITS